jgi:putative ABC transport system ATP-binding protein
MSILSLKNVSYGYIDGNKKRTIINELSYDFEVGKFYTIFGPSGSGKTTLLSLIGALEKTQEGAILFDGQSIESIGLSKYRRNHQSIVFQQFNLLPYLSALDNVINVMNITNNPIPKPYKETALKLLNQLGIVESKAIRSIQKLSGGEQQRVAIARALATNVKLILADEPTGNLDTDTEHEIISIFKNLAHEHQCCVIVVSHSQEVAKESDVSLRLTNGKLIEIKGGKHE